MIIVFFMTALLLTSLGAAVRFGKASWLIAGYNTSSKAEQEKYDESAMCRFVGNLLFTLAFLQIALAAAFYLQSMIMMAVIVALFFTGTIGAVIYMNTGNRFKK